MSLNPKQTLFCHEYIKDQNAKQAAIRAGYSERSAENQGSRMMGIDEVKSYIEELMGNRIKKTESDLEEHRSYLKRIANSSMKQFAKWNESGVSFIPSNELTDEEAQSIIEVSESTNQHGGQLKIKRIDPLRARELLLKLDGHLKDKVEHSGSVTLENLIVGSTEEDKGGTG